MLACIKRMVAQNFISVKDCGVDNFPEIIRVPLDVGTPTGVDYSDYQHGGDLMFEVRVLMQLDGIMVPLLDSCCMEGDGDDRYHISPQCGFEGQCLSTDLAMDITYPDTDNDFRLNSLDIKWMFLNAETWDGIPHLSMGKGEQVMRVFHKANATRLITKTESLDFKYSFACDYERDTQNPELFDFERKKPDD